MKTRAFSPVNWFFLIGLVLTTVIVTPSTSYDPFNVSKFVLLNFFSFGLIGFIVANVDLVKVYKMHKVIVSLLILFCLQSIFVLFNGKTSVVSQLFGTDGRNTGFIFYLSLIFMFFFILIIQSDMKANYLIYGLIFAGIVNILYGLIQFLNLDPINWINPYNRVFGFFGNPNFMSSFMAIVSATFWSILFSSQLKYQFRALLILGLASTLFVISVSDSLQGLIVYILGLMIALFLKFISSKRIKFFPILFLSISFLVVIVTVFDILQRTPWQSILYKESVSYRGDLWRSAWRMGTDNPVSGVGFDGFGNFYRQYRDPTAIIERGAATTSNSAHNVFLDILTNGGFPLLILYILINIMVIKSLLRITKNLKEYDPFFTSIASGWLCYQTQSVISINQIGIAIWGWALGAAIIAYDRSISYTNDRDNFYKLKSKKPNYVFQIIGASIGLVISIPSFLVDSNFRESIDSRQIELVLQSAYKWPQSPERMHQVASMFYQNEILDLAEQVAKDAVKEFPRSYENWQLLSNIYTVSEAEKLFAIERMQDLDPNN
jgi:O-antigen ligase